MKFKYSTGHNSEVLTFTSPFDMSDIELGCLEDVGAEAGHHFYENYSGKRIYDDAWPIDFTIYDINDIVLGIVSVDKYMEPAFSSYVKEDFVNE